MWVISRKAYRFKHPTIKLLESLTEEHAKGKVDPEKRAYCEVKPGTAPGAFGEPTQIPNWAKTDAMFKAALINKNLMVLPEVNAEPETVVRPPQDNAAIAATLASAQRQTEGIALGGETLEVGKVVVEEPSTTSNKKPGKK
jgi:hypothetical protein